MIECPPLTSMSVASRSGWKSGVLPEVAKSGCGGAAQLKCWRLQAADKKTNASLKNMHGKATVPRNSRPKRGLPAFAHAVVQSPRGMVCHGALSNGSRSCRRFLSPVVDFNATEAKENFDVGFFPALLERCSCCRCCCCRVVAGIVVDVRSPFRTQSRAKGRTSSTR